jgi:hypothetical protein
MNVYVDIPGEKFNHEFKFPGPILEVASQSVDDVKVEITPDGNHVWVRVYIRGCLCSQGKHSLVDGKIIYNQ